MHWTFILVPGKILEEEHGFPKTKSKVKNHSLEFFVVDFVRDYDLRFPSPQNYIAYCIGFHWIGFHWIGLDWIIRLYWIGINWIGQGWIVWASIRLDLIELISINSAQFIWIQSKWTGLCALKLQAHWYESMPKSTTKKNVSSIREMHFFSMIISEAKKV